MEKHDASPGDSEGLERALAEIDRIHGGDPSRVVSQGVPVARELDYARRSSAWLLRLVPEPSAMG